MATFQSIDPASGDLLAQFSPWNDAEIERALTQVEIAATAWRAHPLADRCALLRKVAAVLRARKQELARLITAEMGKLRREAEAEVEKCALGCDYYAEHASAFLADEQVATEARRSIVSYQPLGTVLAIMPWNFPFWQVFRFAAPALAAGNTAVLKHASNVPQCALAIEEVFQQAGFPAGVFRTFMVASEQMVPIIADRRIHAVTLTGSEAAGRKVAAAAGAALKKCVLELGGSDPFVVLDDADLGLAVTNAVTSRFLNAGQSCIAAKRFIVLDAVAESFVTRFREAVGKLVMGDPAEEQTSLAPLARADLRDEVHAQVQTSLQQGAKAVIGCRAREGAGWFYLPSILDHVRPGTTAFDEELFGPVASVIRVADEEDAVRVANATRFGLGASVWTQNLERGERFARRFEAGVCFVNGLVKSDPRMPFGGIKASGFGRELARVGMLEFVNTKSIWIA